MIGTRGVLALFAGTLMVLAIVLDRLDRSALAVGAMAVAFGVASLWSILSIYWSQSNPSLLAAKEYLLMTTMAVTATIYYGYKAMSGVGLTESL